MKCAFDIVAAVGDVGDPQTWSGIPYHFWRAAQRTGREVRPGRLSLSKHKWARLAWNLRQLATGRGLGGYQYSREFLDRAEQEFFRADDCRDKTVLSFHHHFPRATSVRAAGGRIVYYLDATLAAELDGHALSLDLPRRTARDALEIERENLANAHHVVTMARWLREYLVGNNLLAAEQVSVVLPGANLDLPVDCMAKRRSAPAQGFPFVLGFVGNDWQRKGLNLLIDVARRLNSRGHSVKILVVGDCPKELAPDCTEVLGPIDKRFELTRFIDALQRCDLGCLFSEREAFGISLLEFLRLGVPVAGFTHEGPADSVPPDAGLRISLGTSADGIAQELGSYIGSNERQKAFRDAASEWSGRLTWERCVEELEEQLSAGFVQRPVQPWRGLTPANA
jgi:glycosyltransferase involved in cell wall biosynthesis